MPNHLVESASPYLLQHQHNPVDWYPWGLEALTRAKREMRPIFLSVGYAACHWCHVMERESFEDEAIAKLLNEHYVCIKVDREERPDIDQIYMMAVQMLTGHGGWPLNVFLSPEGRPFYGGTYWPPKPRHGLPAFGQILMAIRDAWEERREQVLEQADALTGDLVATISRPGHTDDAAGGILSQHLLITAANRLVEACDKKWGGFGTAPKFPHCGDLELLLRVWSRTGDENYLDIVQITLQRMAAGGIYDHLAGGFSRYSVDREWLVPHFEKMLYDNAQLAGIYLRGYQSTGNQGFACVATETLEYLVRDLSDVGGGLHSSEDADSEGIEGKFYVWTRDEILSVLGADRGEVFCQAFGVTAWGNFEGKNILHQPQSTADLAASMGIDVKLLAHELKQDAAMLLAVRTQRIAPGRDDKVLTSWNALAIDALAWGAKILGRDDFLASAERIARFLLDKMRRHDGRLLHVWRRGRAHLDGYLDDYAYFADALITLFETTGELAWLEQAIEYATQMHDHFLDHQSGGLYYTADDHETLIARAKDYVDASVPSAAGTAAVVWLRLAMITGNTHWHAAAESLLTDAASLMHRQPGAAGRMLHALDLYLGATGQIVGVAKSKPELSVLWQNYCRKYRPRSALVPVVIADFTGTPLADIMSGKQTIDGMPTLYVCENFRCQSPQRGFAME